MEKLKGKCKTCLGCNRLEVLEFEGINNCKHYIKANKDRNWFLLIVAIIEILVVLAILYEIYRFMNLLCGG